MEKIRRFAHGFGTLAMAACLFSLLTGCEAADTGAGAGAATDEVTGTPAPLPLEDTDPGQGPTPVPTGTPAPTGKPVALGSSCQGGDSSRYCLSLKYVVYSDGQGKPVITPEQVLSNLAQINTLWAQCNIAFEIGEYVTPDPRGFGLNFNTATSSEMTSVRNEFADDETMLVVTTGAWSGSLGAGSANAWTSMPGETSLGVVLEAAVADYPNLIAHELGHYLNLDHASSSSNMMSPVIYTSSTQLTSAQCSTARSTIQYYWRAMLR